MQLMQDKELWKDENGDKLMTSSCELWKYQNVNPIRQFFNNIKKLFPLLSSLFL